MSRNATPSRATDMSPSSVAMAVIEQLTTMKAGNKSPSSRITVTTLMIPTEPSGAGLGKLGLCLRDDEDAHHEGEDRKSVSNDARTGE
jgi:hypothetical protein